MKKYLVVFCLFCTSGLMAQTLGVNHYIELESGESCYIKAIQQLNLWEVTLSRFNSSTVKDTTFTTQYLHPDTILCAVLSRASGLKVKKDTLKKTTNYAGNIAKVQSVLQKLELTYSKNVIAGQLEVHKKIRIEKTTLIVVPKKEWSKLKYVAPFTTEKSKDPLGTPILRKWKRVVYRDSTFYPQGSVKVSLMDSFEKESKPNFLYAKRIKLSKGIVIPSGKEYKAGDTLDVYLKEKVNKRSDTLLAQIDTKRLSAIICFDIVSMSDLDSVVNPERRSGSFYIKKVTLNDNVLIKSKLPYHANSSITLYSKNDFNEQAKKFEAYVDTLDQSPLIAFEVVETKSLIQPQEINYPFDYADTTRILVYRKRQLLPKRGETRRLGRKKLYVEKTEAKKSAEIKEMQLFIKDGFIDNLSIKVMDNGITMQFTNNYPIPLSSKKNLRLLNYVNLYANLPGGVSYRLNLANALTYLFEVERDQYDLSPSDTVLKFAFDDKEHTHVQSLNKEDKNKIFEYRIFTDFIGLDEVKPNGLVQIEAQRKFKLYTKYSIQRFPIGILRYIEPSFRWNKIENQNSYLQPSLAVDTFRIDSVTRSGITVAQYNAQRTSYVTPLDLYQYQQISVGVNLNLISGYNGNTKLKYTIDGLFNFGRTKIRDSIPEVDTTFAPYRVVNSVRAPREIKVNTLQWGLALRIQFFPEARYGLTVGAKYTNIYLADLRFDQTNKGYDNLWKADTYLNRGILSGDIQIHKNFDNDSKFYIRYVFNSQVNNLKYNFSQFQVGYNAYLKF